MINIILASKSRVRRKILNSNNIDCLVEPSNIDEDQIKESLLKEGASPEIISKNLAETKATKVSNKHLNKLVLGADSVIDLNNQVISKPHNRDEALQILKNLNGKKHNLISSVTIAKNGSMVWNHTDKAELTMKKFTEDELKNYLSKITDEKLYAYNVYQIEGEGRSLFSKIDGDENTVMGLPIKEIKEYLKNYGN
ncbi:MAG: septum formation protein Maf [Pelagibacteraceae bacterium TMED246]|nr:MAG: septum formation protein Maf [Pelagibacteraceae bacterium TMED246]|tara:strand:+ start:24246 stop:24833 length:588 start_codon:yes stop_codon:yes gene_type:complete